ncbi:MAG: hypothetical protein MRT15_08580 [archaeon YNP-LCB-003-016]|uniref:hypothetical protein n=1 Tax=Candidatus Culexarchaeum yellowstonense TaxID=2928963 RepID=UPI0026F1676C|nr:hypothetical protein [Candidatus Culexarchaeum yellowstonense]MCR6692434.1 hypothetical protein [Candidatus Culexarchaeum yellowstonense]
MQGEVEKKPKIKFLMCICTGECPGFSELTPNIWKFMNRVRLELPVEYAAIHPQLCAPDGDKFLRDVLHNDGSYYIIGGCAPFMQEKMFRDALKDKGVEKGKHIALDLRNMKVDDAFNKVAEAVNKIVGGK